MSMSTVGFSPQLTDNELEKLREAWRSLNDVLRNLRNAEAALINRDHNLIAAHLQVAKWNVEQVNTRSCLFARPKSNSRKWNSLPMENGSDRFCCRRFVPICVLEDVKEIVYL
jgi:hypothetical protein